MSFEIDVLFNKVFDADRMSSFGYVPHEGLTPEAVHRVTRCTDEYKSFDQLWDEYFIKNTQ